MLNKAKTTVDALASWDCLMPEHQRLFNAIQDKICRLQSINEFLNNFIIFFPTSNERGDRFPREYIRKKTITPLSEEVGKKYGV